MKAQLEQIKINALAALDAAETPAALEELRVKLLGKKGELTAVLKMMGKLSPEERPVMGQLANALLAFGTYSGLGIKTTLGMGGLQITTKRGIPCSEC